MSNLIITKPQLDALEFQTTQAYNAFRRAVRSEVYEDAHWTAELYNALGGSLKFATEYQRFMEWNRGTEPAQTLDRYLLQLAMGQDPASILKQYTEAKKFGWEQFLRVPNDVTKEAVIHAVDDIKVTYERVSVLGMYLRKAGKFEDVLDVLTHIRDTYKKPYIPTYKKPYVPLSPAEFADGRLDKPVADLGFSTRCRNVLKDCGIVYVGQLVQYDERGLSIRRNFGKNSLHEVEEKLGALGLKLDMKLDNWQVPE